MTDSATLRIIAEQQIAAHGLKGTDLEQTILALLDALEESGVHEVAAVERVSGLEEGLRDLLNVYPPPKATPAGRIEQLALNKARALLTNSGGTLTNQVEQPKTRHIVSEEAGS